MRTHRVQLAVLILSITALVCACVWVTAGTTGSVSGVVKDAETGAALSGANIVIAGTGLSTVTDENGRFVIANIPPGDYDITAQMVGYGTRNLADIQVIMDATASADFDMTKEAIEEEAVVVTRPKPMINPEVVNTFNLVSVQQEPLTRTDPSSVRTAPGMLGTLPGVIVDSDGSGQLHLRGGKYDQVGWYIEGIPITDPNVGAFGTDLLTTGLSKFQMYAGAFGAEYGNAISGVLNEVIKTGATASGMNFVTESGNKTYGSMIGEIGGGTADSFNYYVSANVQQTDLDAPFIKRFEYSDNVAKLVWPFKKDKVTLLAMQGSQYGGLDDYHTLDVYNNTIPSEKDYVRQRYAIGGLEWSHTINPASFVSVQPYYHYFTSITSAMGGSFDGSAQGADIWSKRTGIQAKYVNQLNAVHAFKMGGSIEESNNNYYIAVPDYPYYKADVDTTQSGLYAEDQMKLSDKFIFSAGLRHDSITYDRTGLAYVSGAGYSGDPVGDVTQSKTTPRLGLSYAPDETSAWKTSWGKYAKFVPASSVQMRYFDPENCEPYAPGLGSSDPQTSTNYELTYEKQATDTIAWRATYFNNKFQNLCSFASVDNTYQYRNLGEGKSNGMELYVRKKMTDKWQGWLSYTYAKAKSNRADMSINDQMYYTNWDQRNTVSLVADYKNGKCSHSLRADYGSGKPDMVDSTDALAVRSRAEASAIVSYNLNIDLPKGSKLGDSLYLNVFNVFNNHQTLQYKWKTSTSADDPTVVTTERRTDSWAASRSFALGITRAF
ncbi:MAG: TonB-dependent receptor [Armatimonadota bacterium]